MEVVILMGLQASGKSSFCKRFEGTHRIVSKDLFPNARRPQERQMRMIADALGAGMSVVVDNTNPTVEDRRPIIEAARAAGASVVGYWLESSVDRSLALNAGRQGRNYPVGACFARRHFQGHISHVPSAIEAPAR